MKLFFFKIWKALPFKLKIFLSRLMRPKYMVAVAAIIRDDKNKILLGKHTYRKYHPWGILAGNRRIRRKSGSCYCAGSERRNRAND